MNTLTGIEAERVNQILKHTIERLQILSYVPLSWDDDLVVDIKCQPVLNSLEKLWMCEEQLRDIDSGMGLASGGKDIHLIKQMHRCVRGVCRNFLADRGSLQVLMSRPELQSEDFTKFIKYLNEGRAQVLQKLTTTVEDEMANRALLHDLTEKERQYEESRDVLQTKLNELRAEKEQVTQGLDNTIRKLQNELHDITQHNSIEIESVQKEMNEAINKATADHELRMRQLQDRVDAMERNVNEVVAKNKEEEQRLRKEKSRMESALNSKIAQYDEDMKSRHEQLDELNQAFTKESEEYAVLKEHFDKIDADIGRNDEEERILAAVQRREDFGNWVLFMAAANIQKIHRGKMSRLEVAKLKAKAKKGKKGKKK
mmetsp:Transcript_21985/g.36827  ORF Transcript_21985/g.36827 Transcript_21985/m.36827 type:complete len:371 (+) Transcript_21985:73-1185(+)